MARPVVVLERMLDAEGELLMVGFLARASRPGTWMVVATLVVAACGGGAGPTAAPASGSAATQSTSTATPAAAGSVAATQSTSTATPAAAGSVAATQSTSTATPAAAGSVGPVADACGLVTTAEAEAILGAPLTRKPTLDYPGPQYGDPSSKCHYNAADISSSEFHVLDVKLDATVKGSDAVGRFDKERTAQGLVKTDLSGLGDGAWFIIIGPTSAYPSIEIAARHGTTVVYFTLSGVVAADTDSALGALKTLMATSLSRIPEAFNYHA
jgi:hypothetical protein